MGIPAATVHRILSALADEDVVTSDDLTGRWSLGPEFWRLALRGGTKLRVSAMAVSHLERLVAECNETAFLCIFDPARKRVMFAASVESKQPIRYVVELYAWLPVNLAASSLAILAWLPEPELTAMCATGELASVDRVKLQGDAGPHPASGLCPDPGRPRRRRGRYRRSGTRRSRRDSGQCRIDRARAAIRAGIGGRCPGSGRAVREGGVRRHVRPCRPCCTADGHGLRRLQDGHRTRSPARRGSRLALRQGVSADPPPLCPAPVRRCIRTGRRDTSSARTRSGPPWSSNSSRSANRTAPPKSILSRVETSTSASSARIDCRALANRTPLDSSNVIRPVLRSS